MAGSGSRPYTYYAGNMTSSGQSENGQRQHALAPSLERRRLRLYLLQLIGDGAVLMLGFALVSYLYLGDPMDPAVWDAAQLLLPLFWTVALLNQTYSVGSLVSPSLGLQRALLALGLAMFLLIVVLFLARSSLFVSRFGFASGIIAASFLLIWLRVNVSSYVRRSVGPRAINLLVIDDGGPAVDLHDCLRLEAAAAGLSPRLDDPHWLDRFATVIRNMDRVIVSCPPERRWAWAMVLKGGLMRGEIVDGQVNDLGILGTSRAEGVGTLVVASGPLGLRSRALKRALDLAITVPALLVLGIPLLVVAALIHLEDGGPALFLQRRVGRNNQFFSIYKFRSMRQASADAGGAQSTRRDDDRVTRIGRFLRKTSIDELPQLLNVLKGDMSLVGPRPHALASQAGEKLFWEVDSRYWQRHALKPGMSGLAQIRGFRGATDNEGDLVDRLQADLEYVEGWTIMRDIRILFSTIWVVVHDRAY